MQTGNGATNFMAQLLGVAPMGVSRAANSIGTAANAIATAGGATPQFDSGIKGIFQKAAWSKQQQAGGGATAATGAESAGNADDAYQAYLDRAGYAPAMRELSRGVTGQGAASGLLSSGTTLKRLQTRGAELNNGYFNNYMQQLAGLSGLGLQAGGLIANAGQKSTETRGGPSTAGAIASTVGSIASIFSDRRTKKDIVHLDNFEDGLGVYAFRYVADKTNEIRIGVMADEVEKIRPWAMGPTLGGFKTVNYAAL